MGWGLGWGLGRVRPFMSLLRKISAVQMINSNLEPVRQRILTSPGRVGARVRVKIEKCLGRVRVGMLGRGLGSGLGLWVMDGLGSGIGLWVMAGLGLWGRVRVRRRLL